MQTVTGLLSKARDSIEGDGWTFGTFQNMAGQRCALGALYAADGDAGRYCIEARFYPPSFKALTKTAPEYAADLALMAQAYDYLTAAVDELDWGEDAIWVRAVASGNRVWRINDAMGQDAVLRIYAKAIELSEAAA
jgi:hypothetical protein